MVKDSSTHTKLLLSYAMKMRFLSAGVRGELYSQGFLRGDIGYEI